MSIDPRLNRSVGKSHRFKLRKSRWLAVTIVVIVLLSASAVGALLILNKKQPAAQKADQLQQAKKIDKIINNAENLANNGKTDAANASYDQAINNTTKPSEKSFLTLGKATLAFNAGKYDEALAIAKQAEAISKDSAVTSLIAQIYEKKGDNKKAADYYQQTVNLLDKNSLLYKADRDYYQAQANELNGKGK